MTCHVPCGQRAKECVDGWVDGRIDGRMDACMDGSMDGCMDDIRLLFSGVLMPYVCIGTWVGGWVGE